MAKITRGKTPADREDSHPDEDDLVFKALANADRRAILDLLRRGPQTTGQICESIHGLARCTVMLHLRVLEQADLVITQKKGRNRWNYLNVVPIQRIYNRWIEAYAQPAAQLLNELKLQMEERS